MGTMINTICKAVLAMCLLVAGNAYAATITWTGSTAEIGSPGSIPWIFSAPGGAASLDFQLAGYGSLDGGNIMWTDVFTLSVNDTKTFSGTWNLGGGGDSVILYNPTGGTAKPTFYDYWKGGIVDISVPISLINGNNTINFAYNGSDQGLADEGWGVNSASVNTASPIPAAIWLIGSALIGLVGFARRRLTYS